MDEMIYYLYYLDGMNVKLMSDEKLGVDKARLSVIGKLDCSY